MLITDGVSTVDADKTIPYAVQARQVSNFVRNFTLIILLFKLTFLRLAILGDCECVCFFFQEGIAIIVFGIGSLTSDEELIG